MRNNDKTKARAEEREKNIGWIKRLFTAWRVSHAERAERRAEQREAGEDESEEDETPVVVPSPAATMHPKGTPAPTTAVQVHVCEERVDLSNDMAGWDKFAVGVRRIVLARGELDKLEGPKYAARRAELRRKVGEEARARERQATAPSQDEAEESDVTEEEATRERRTRVGRPRGGMKVAARIGEGLRREIGRSRRPR